MTVKDLKEALEGYSDNAQVMVVGYNAQTGESIERYANQCCNFEYQQENNEFWISNEGVKRQQ